MPSPQRPPAEPAGDPRRHIPRTDTLLADPQVQEAAAGVGHVVLKSMIATVTARARGGQIAPDEVKTELLAALGQQRHTPLRPVINATGVLIHTNLGRAPLSPQARDAVTAATGYVDVELDVVTGVRARRGAGVRAALLAAVPAAEEALVVNNCASALALVASTFARQAPAVISRGELIEIGAGFRLPELMHATGAELVEIGATNRTHLPDYLAVLDGAGVVLKVHPSNYRVHGFTAAVEVAELAPHCQEAGVPLIVDIGSGLLHPNPLLPDEPDFASALAAGADAVIASGDKLLGGPQAGIILGRRAIVDQLARNPLARAVRADKLALAGLEATVRSGTSPVAEMLARDTAELAGLTRELAEEFGLEVVDHAGRVGGGGAVDVALPGYALQLPARCAQALRSGEPAVLARVNQGHCLVDLRCVPEEQMPALRRRLREVLAADVGETAGPEPAGSEATSPSVGGRAAAEAESAAGEQP